MWGEVVDRFFLSSTLSLSHSLVVVLRWFERTHIDKQRFSGDDERDERRKWQRESFWSGGISLAQAVRFPFGSFEWSDDQIYRHECRNSKELPHSPEEKRYFPFSPFLFLRMSLDASSRSRGMLITSLVHNSTARRCSSSSSPSMQQSHTILWSIDDAFDRARSYLQVSHSSPSTRWCVCAHQHDWQTGNTEKKSIAVFINRSRMRCDHHLINELVLFSKRKRLDKVLHHDYGDGRISSVRTRVELCRRLCCCQASRPCVSSIIVAIDQTSWSSLAFVLP